MACAQCLCVLRVLRNGGGERSDDDGERGGRDGEEEECVLSVCLVCA